MTQRLRRNPLPAWLLIAVVAALGISLGLVARAASAGDPATSRTLQDAISARNVARHLRALDEIAAAEGGNRFTGTAGYERSVDYVADVLEDAGLDVRREDFGFYAFDQRSPTVLRIAEGHEFQDGVDVRAMMYSASDDVSGRLVAVSFDRSGRSGGPACSPTAFDDDPVTGAIVLLRPGRCLYREQVRNVARAGAAAVLFAFPPTGGGDRSFRPTLFSPEGIDIPAVAVTDEAGRRLIGAEGSIVEVRTDVSSRRSQAENLIAETRSGDDEHIVMVGAHLDSVFDGPGINDNGSGSATILELARQIATLRTDDKVRFAFWGGEELGLVGSSSYVRALSADERASIDAYLNFDMVGSPNDVRFVYSPEGSPPGSTHITELFLDHFDDHTLTATQLDLAGRSDHGPFIQAGIPVGGLFTGAEDPKTPDEVSLFGGRVGVAHDPCYHQACDTIDNVNLLVLDEMADAMAHAVATLAGQTDPLSGGAALVRARERGPVARPPFVSPLVRFDLTCRPLGPGLCLSSPPVGIPSAA